jgi:hypothetical protein
VVATARPTAPSTCWRWGAWAGDPRPRAYVARRTAEGLSKPEIIRCLKRYLARELSPSGIMPLYTPLGGSWLNMTESIQRILARRALAGQQPASPADIIAWLEATARAWNAEPTPCEWGGRRHARRERAYRRLHPLGGSGACTRNPLRRRLHVIEQWRHSWQVTH